MKNVILHEKPPNWGKIASRFNVNWEDGVIVTYGQNIYCEKPISYLKVVHESVHMGQQTNPEEWWEKYYNDVEFRLSQELEAYKEEAKAASNIIKDRNQLYRYIQQICFDISSPMYDNIITYGQAYNIFKKYIL